MAEIMARRNVWIKAAVILFAVWMGVWALRSFAGSKRITSARVDREIAAANFADWSDLRAERDVVEAKRREGALREIAEMVNRLDFQEREKNRENRSGEAFFRKLSAEEKSLFIDLTVMESMSRFMQSLDAMTPEQRKKFVEQGLKEIREGRTEAEMARADELGEDLLNKISEEGMKAYFQKSSADTKLDLAPLMEAMNEAMQGLRGNEFGPR
jgi:hypothetical protein